LSGASLSEIGASVLTQQLPFSAGKGRGLCQAALAAICALALAGCGSSKNAYVPPPPPKVTVAQPVQQPVTLYVHLTGNTEPFNTVTLVARVEGYVESIDYKDGAFVTKGTQLFGIERDSTRRRQPSPPIRRLRPMTNGSIRRTRCFSGKIPPPRLRWSSGSPAPTRRRPQS
jgi:hypothetical protein